MNKLQVTSAQIENVEKYALTLPQVECKLVHIFAPGVYYRQIHMPAGTFVIGQEHKTRHLNMVISGRVHVMMDGVVEEIVAPCTFISEVGVRKALSVVEDTVWATIHPTDETDLIKLEELLIEKSQSFIEHENNKLQLQEEQQQQTWVAIAVTSIALTAVSAGVGTYGALYSAKAQSNAADFNAKVAANNAGAAVQQAKFDSTQIADATRRNTANQRAAMAASGFDANTGSFTDVSLDTKRQGEMNRLARIYQGRLGSNQQKSQAMLYSSEAGYDKTAGYFGAATTLLGGAAQATNIASSNPAFQ